MGEQGKGLEGKGRGSDKGPITVSVGPIRRSGSHPRRLVSTSYALWISCHGRGRGFEPRRPRHINLRKHEVYGIVATLRFTSEGANEGAETFIIL